MDSMSERVRLNRAQVATIAEANMEQMAAQLDRWSTRVDALVAGAHSSEAETSDGLREAVTVLKSKYEISRARFQELRTAGSSHWRLYRPGIEHAWADFEATLDKLTNRLGHGHDKEEHL
jgi:hypothetical protein